MTKDAAGIGQAESGAVFDHQGAQGVGFEMEGDCMSGLHGKAPSYHLLLLPYANMGERNRAGWRAGIRTGEPEGSHTRPAHIRCSHARGSNSRHGQLLLPSVSTTGRQSCIAERAATGAR